MKTFHRNLRLRRMAAAAPLALALAVAVPATAAAQDTGFRGSATVQAGQPAQPIQPPGEAPVMTVPSGTWTLTPALGFGFGGNLENSPLSIGVSSAYNLTSRVAIEGELSYLRAARQGVVDEFESGVTTGSVNALYHFAVDGWAPYATVGVGFGHAGLDDDRFGTDDSETTLMVNFGGGLKTRLSERVNLRTDVRYYNGNDFVPDFWRPTIGLTFFLNGPATTP